MTAPVPKNGSQRKWPIGIFVALIGVGIAGFAMMASAPETSRDTWPKEFTDTGEQLYFTGRSETGAVMVARGGNHHRTMMGNGGCASCHGTDREGGRLWPSFWQVAPAITRAALTGDHGADGHSHETYTTASLARAITDGVRPDGSEIGLDMPRWSMSPQSLDDLVNYLLSPPDTH